MADHMGRLVVGLACCLVLVSVVPPAAAQATPAVEVSGGYAFSRDLTEKINFPAGWYADVAGNISDWLGIVGSVTGAYKSDSGVDIDTLGFAVGPRLSIRTNKLVPFVQVLVGGARSSVSVEAFGVDVSQTNLTVGAGGGVNVTVNENLGVRFGADYGRVFSDLGDTNGFRFSAGAVFGFGER